MDRFLEFMNKWISPFTVTAALGFVIWLVQLNAAILHLTDRTSMIEQQKDYIESDQQALALILSRTTAVQESLTYQIERLDSRMTRNESLIIQNKRGEE